MQNKTPEDVKPDLLRKHINPMYGSLEAASISNFIETGRISGSFKLRLEALIKDACEPLQSELTKLREELRILKSSWVVEQLNIIRNKLNESKKSHADDLSELMKLREENEKWKRSPRISLEGAETFVREANQLRDEIYKLTAKLSKAKELIERCFSHLDMEGGNDDLETSLQQFLNEII